MGKITNVAKAWGVGQEQLRQMLAFDKELEDTISENHDLKAKKLSLEAKVEDLQNAVNGLKKQLEEQTAKTARAEKLAAFKGSKSAQPDESVVHKQLDVPLMEVGITCRIHLAKPRKSTRKKHNPIHIKPKIDRKEPLAPTRRTPRQPKIRPHKAKPPRADPLPERSSRTR